jgi:uncharacterized protein YbaR (Trm112 family)
MIDPRLLEVVACPQCRSTMDATDEDSMTCTDPDCRLVYPVREGVPVLLVDEAVRSEGDSATVVEDNRDH